MRVRALQEAQETFARQRAEEERERQEEEERLRLEEQRAIEEAERLEKERQRAAEEKAQLEREEKARREEAERQARLKKEQEHKEVADWCQGHGFADISAPRRNGCTAWSAATTYPLHLAVELADAHIVGLLLKEGANPEQKNSSGKTAGQVAQKKDKNGSHREVKRLLTGTAAPQAAGA